MILHLPGWETVLDRTGNQRARRVSGDNVFPDQAIIEPAGVLGIVDIPLEDKVARDDLCISGGDGRGRQVGRGGDRDGVARFVFDAVAADRDVHQRSSSTRSSTLAKSKSCCPTPLIGVSHRPRAVVAASHNCLARLEVDRATVRDARLDELEPDESRRQPRCGRRDSPESSNRRPSAAASTHFRFELHRVARGSGKRCSDKPSCWRCTSKSR